MWVLFGEEAGLCGGGSGCGGFAAGDADDTEDGQLREGRAGDEDAVGGGGEIGRGDLYAVVEQRKQIIGDDAFEGFVVGVTQANPQTVQFWATEKRLALRLKIVGELPDKINGAHLVEGNGLVLAVLSEEVGGVGM